MKNNLNLICIFLIVVIGVIIYANSIDGKFIWDDRMHIEHNVSIKNFSHLPEIFYKNMGTGAGYPTRFYRPLQAFSYMIDYSLWGMNPKGYHLTNIIIHILTALAVYYLANILTGQILVSFLSGAFFLTHPLSVETVAFISDRSDSLSVLFMLLCIIFYIRYSGKESIKAYSLISGSFLLALLSKENSMIFPALLLIYHGVFKKKLEAKKFVLLFGILFYYLAFRYIKSGSDFHILSASNIQLHRLPGFFAAIAGYLKVIFFPFDLHMEYSYKIFNFFEPDVILGLVLTILLLSYAFIKRKKEEFVTFSIIWFFIALLPVSNIYYIGDSYMAERWLYLPSVGLFLFFAYKLYQVYNVKSLKIPVAIFSVAILSFYSVLTIKQNGYWRDPIYFCERTLKYNPESARIYNELAFLYEGSGRTEDAITAYKKAIEYDPECIGIRSNLENLYRSIEKQ